MVEGRDDRIEEREASEEGWEEREAGREGGIADVKLERVEGREEGKEEDTAE